MTIEQIRSTTERRGQPACAGWNSARNGASFGIPECEFTPSVRRAVGALVSEARALRDAADRDHLLPLLNRRAFMRELGREIASVARYRAPSSLVYLDIDGLKPINDAYGHAGGDAVLAHFAGFLLAHVRGSDVVGRLGGDEFGIVLTHANAAQAASKCGSLAGLLAAEPARWGETPIPLAFSFGLLELSAGMGDEYAVASADAEMYRRRRLTR